MTSNHILKNIISKWYYNTRAKESINIATCSSTMAVLATPALCGLSRRYPLSVISEAVAPLLCVGTINVSAIQCCLFLPSYVV